MLFIRKKCLRVNLCENTDLKEIILVSCIWAWRGVVWLWKPLMSWPAVHSQVLKSHYRPCAVPENVFWEWTVYTSLSQRRLIPSVGEPLQEILAQAPRLGVLSGAIWSEYEICVAGADFVWPERKYSLSHRHVKQTSISNLSFTTPQEHLLLSSSEILLYPLSLSCTRERWLCRLFCIFSREALVLKVFCELVME